MEREERPVIQGTVQIARERFQRVVERLSDSIETAARDGRRNGLLNIIENDGELDTIKRAKTVRAALDLYRMRLLGNLRGDVQPNVQAQYETVCFTLAQVELVIDLNS